MPWRNVLPSFTQENGDRRIFKYVGKHLQNYGVITYKRESKSKFRVTNPKDANE
jgi:hypothetical protein